MVNNKINVWVVLVCFFVTSNVWAVGSGGYTNQVPGARAYGMANAFVAQSDDIQAIVFNPAGLTQMKGYELGLGETWQVPVIQYKDKAGVKNNAEIVNLFVPNLYFGGKSGQGKFGYGLGVYSPFGLTTEWKTNHPLRFAATESILPVINVNPSLAYQFNPKLSAGLGIDYFNSSGVKVSKQLDVATLNTLLTFLPSSAPEGEQTLEGDGDGWGYNLGLLYTPNERHSFGLAWRSEVKVDYDGEVSLKNLSGFIASPFVFGVTNYKTSAKTDITYPGILTAGYAWRPKENWVLEADIEWTGWSSYKEQKFTFSETNATRLAFLNSGNPVSKRWNDVGSFAIGTEYVMPNKLALRGGGSFLQVAAPSATLEPSTPDVNLIGLALGVGYPWGDSLKVDLAYQALLGQPRSIDNKVGSPLTTVDGTYKGAIHGVALSLSYKF